MVSGREAPFSLQDRGALFHLHYLLRKPESDGNASSWLSVARHGTPGGGILPLCSLTDFHCSARLNLARNNPAACLPWDTHCCLRGRRPGRAPASTSFCSASLQPALGVPGVSAFSLLPRELSSPLAESPTSQQGFAFSEPVPGRAAVFPLSQIQPQPLSLPKLARGMLEASPALEADFLLHQARFHGKAGAGRPGLLALPCGVRRAGSQRSGERGRRALLSEPLARSNESREAAQTLERLMGGEEKSGKRPRSWVRAWGG